jgi:hypothetical protein
MEFCRFIKVVISALKYWWRNVGQIGIQWCMASTILHLLSAMLEVFTCKLCLWKDQCSSLVLRFSSTFIVIFFGARQAKNK